MAQADIPVLILGFNRPDRVRQLIERLRIVKPREVFFAVDGPREQRATDAELVKQTQELTAEFDWDCTVHTLFQSENLGCAHGVTAGINWFFTHVEEGIILEDDVLPDPSFLPFCSELLDRYRDDSRVWCISGSNRLPSETLWKEYSYRFSAIPQVWGWATWRDRWEKYSLDIRNWRSQGLSNLTLLKTVNYSPSAFAFWSANFDLMAKMAVDTWDTQLVNAAMRNRALAVIPNVNLVENIGWGGDATHTHQVPPSLQDLAGISFPLQHPTVSVDTRADREMNRLVYQATPIGLLRQFNRYRAKSRDVN
jgi:hypothetical protein